LRPTIVAVPFATMSRLIWAMFAAACEPFRCSGIGNRLLVIVTV
jgi:hypothetical protein